MSERTLRQRLVPEIGDAGQARIERAVIEIDPTGLPGEIAARYLEHAGFAEVRRRPGMFRHASALIDTLSRDVLAEADAAVVSIAVGAALAVDHIRKGIHSGDRGTKGES